MFLVLILSLKGKPLGIILILTKNGVDYVAIGRLCSVLRGISVILFCSAHSLHELDKGSATLHQELGDTVVIDLLNVDT